MTRGGGQPGRAREAPRPAEPARSNAGRESTRAERPAASPRVEHRFGGVRVHADDPVAAVPGTGPLLDEPGQALDRQVGARVGAAYGRDFSGVRVHHGTPGAAIAGRRSARAVTVGRHVAFAPGAYRPGSAMGDALIAHELAHVAQQDGASAVAAAPAHGALEADADRAAAGAVLASQGRPPAGGRILPALRTGLALQSCNGGGPKTFEEAVKADDYERAAALIGAEKDDGKVMEKLKTLSKDQLGKLDAAVVKHLGGGADRIHRPILFLLHGPAAGTAHTEINVADAGTANVSAKAGGGDVEARTGAKIARRGRTESLEPAFSIGYKGADASKSRWLQFIWREIVVTHPVKGTFRVDEAVTSSAKHGYRLTTDPARPVYNTDSASDTDPFYEAGFADNRAADATTIFDLPGSFKSVVDRQFDAGATTVVSRAHFTTYLVRDMQVLYAVTTDVEWTFASKADNPKPAQSQAGKEAKALDPDMRKKLEEQYPDFAYFP